LLEYLGELNPKALLPPAGTMERFRLREWLGYIATEVHKSCSPLFRPTTPEGTVTAMRALLARRLAYIDLALAGKSYLMGEQFTVADAYLYVITTWFPRIGVDLGAYPNLKAYSARVEARPAVQRALRDEGLLKAA
jgi:glutathione S-transferase